MNPTEIQKKTQYGDFATLAKVLGIGYEAAKKRFYRCDEEAMKTMLKIVEAREKLIQGNNPKESTNQ